MHWLDCIVTWGVAALVMVTPLAIGSVYPWAFKPMEVVIFLLSAVWMAKLWWQCGEPLVPVRRLGRVIIPGAVFLMLALLQLCPLPPRLMRFVSPSTYALYVRTLPGWPGNAPYAKLRVDRMVAHGGGASGAAVVLPSVDEVRNGAPLPFAPQEDGGVRAPRSDTKKAGIEEAAKTHAPEKGGVAWRPLSVTPMLTWPGLLKALGYSALFLVVVCYPFGNRETQERFYRVVFWAIVSAGFLAAVFGLAEWAAWNGKVLWFFVPRDWGTPRFDSPLRASGPFVNPDHFANYLAMAFALALGGALFRAPRTVGPDAYRVLCGGVALIISSAIVLSLSRAGWLDSFLAVTVLLLLCKRPESAHGSQDSRETSALSIDKGVGLARRPASSATPRGRFSRPAAVLGFGFVAVIALGAFSLLFIGPQGRMEAGTRLEETMTIGTGLWTRLLLWKDSLRMIRDFPVFGVGLSAWPEMFPHYRGGPWSPMFERSALNDYLQLLAETGAVGCCALGALFVRAGAEIFSRFTDVSELEAPFLGSLLAGLAVMAFHELFDCSFRIPANALLFTVIFGLALRIARTQEAEIEAVSSSRPMPARYGSACATALFLVLAAGAVTQRAAAYPYDVPLSVTASQALDAVLKHPVSSPAHLWLALMLHGEATRETRLRELETAAWLAPNDPRVRDMYAQDLMHMGRKEAALAQIALSVLNSPTLNTHFYLGPKFLPLLSPDERKAVTDGFEQAIAAHYRGAVGGLGDLYASLDRFVDEARLFERAAGEDQNQVKRAADLVAAGEAYARGGRVKEAEQAFREAATEAPSDLMPYQYSIKWIYGPEKDLASAQSAVHTGIRNGADPLALYKSLADAAEACGDVRIAEDALADAVKYQLSPDTVMRLGLFYLRQRKLDKAVATLRDATELAPDSADAFYYLGFAEELNYQYVSAGKHYALAAKLAPDNPEFRRQYANFEHKMNAAHEQ